MIPFDYDDGAGTTPSADRGDLDATGERPAGAPADAPPPPISDEDFDDLLSVIDGTTMERGRTYQRQGRVADLARLPGGGLLAWVSGTTRYATRVDPADSSSSCTCPVRFFCKHGVAVVLDYRARRAEGSDVPLADPRDARLDLLAAALGDDDFEDDDPFADDDLYLGWSGGARRRGGAAPTGDGPPIRPYLEGLSRDGLIALVEELATTHAAVRSTLRDRVELSSGTAGDLVRSAMREVERLGSAPASPFGDGHYPIDSLDRVRDRLRRLLDAGHPDAVVQVGDELARRGFAQVEMTDDEGEMSAALGEALSVVVAALPRSSRSPVEQMLWVFDAERRDPYDAMDAGAFWDAERPPETWSAFADALARRLRDDRPPPRDRRAAYATTSDYAWRADRDALTGALIRALERAGREDEVGPVLEREAEESGAYVRLVEWLMRSGRDDVAAAWAHKGVVALMDAEPGTAERLAGVLRAVAERRGDWRAVAAHDARAFFSHPSVTTLRALEAAAERAGVRDAVRAAALAFLETGRFPDGFAQRPAGAALGAEAGGATLPARGRRARADASARSADPAPRDAPAPAWPLPDLGLPTPLAGAYLNQPRLDVLVELAIQEGRPEDVLRWHAALRARPTWLGGPGLDDRVASAVAATHPARAAEIWTSRAEAHIAQTSVGAYETAADYLEKLRDVLDPAAWREVVLRLREANRRKRRLVEVLDRLLAYDSERGR